MYEADPIQRLFYWKFVLSERGYYSAINFSRDSDWGRPAQYALTVRRVTWSHHGGGYNRNKVADVNKYWYTSKIS